MSEKKNTFSSSIGFILAAAGSAVGLGNIWRFPYLAAKDGGGTFLLIYIILALSFGFTLLITEISIGRKTKHSCLKAYGRLHSKFKWLGLLASFVPFLIFPYYCLIGGWVLKYCTTYLAGHGIAASGDSYFTDYITGIYPPIIFFVIFLLATSIVVYRGVNSGIEKLSKILMPMLLVLLLVIAIFSLTITGNEGRTGFDGLMIYLIPDVKSMTPGKVFHTLIDAMGQLFYSISVAMGIMVTYGSYLKDDDNLVGGVNKIEIFDTIVAFLAGIMIIPAVFAFFGSEGMQNSGPGLMFATLPKVFTSMGRLGNVLGIVFFLMVLLAALTSSVSILEAVVSCIMDYFKCSRKKAVIIETVIGLVLGVFISLGYNIFYIELKLPNGSTAQILDIFDYISNYILMPIVAISTCILVGWVVKPKTVIDEATKNDEKFGRKKLYLIMIKYITPVLLTILLLGSFGVFN
ncbi:sodium-dependent transporter [Eubacterium xylanophilum]|uniref:sodium-dependent transporter n=1 Tax=Eubacterium xylanophilum TaxID=39497 RepID=UPI00047B6BAD|nr:sodium-dependent transporter [Eubacterium xylanophilum]